MTNTRLLLQGRPLALRTRGDGRPGSPQTAESAPDSHLKDETSRVYLTRGAAVVSGRRGGVNIVDLPRTYEE